MARAGEDVDVAGRWGRLRVRQWGLARGSAWGSTGRLVIGLAGLTGHAENLAPLAARLADDGVRVAAVDLRGRGGSEVTPPGTYGWARHAEDVLAVASALGADRFAVVGQSMGGSVAMKIAELEPARLDAVVLVDVAGRVDPGVGPVIERTLARVGPMNGADPAAVAEDRAYTATQHPSDRWAHLTMPTLLVRATRELEPGAGFVVPAAERDAFRRAVPHAQVVELDGTHVTVNTHPDLAPAVGAFLAAVPAG